MAIAKGLAEFKKKFAYRVIDGKKYHLYGDGGYTKNQANANVKLAKKQRSHLSFRTVKIGTGGYYSKGHEYAIYVYDDKKKPRYWMGKRQ